MPTLHGRITDAANGELREAKVSVVDCEGGVRTPEGAVLKVGNGLVSFYCGGEFSVPVKGGPCRIVVERGTEYEPLVKHLNVPWKGDLDVTLELRRWVDLPRMGWYPGNTHIHYDQNEKQPYERLRLEPHVNDFAVTVVSILQRWDLPYASNRFPLGAFTEFSTAHHVVDVGEEVRHNFWEGGFGYGHLLVFRIHDQVEPLSRGMLVNDFNPDYPPLCLACDDAHRQGGIVVWCHNGLGMEAPVAAALGKLDALNLFDPYWMNPEYDLWYKMLNCGFHLPASTGSDWFVCSNNRVYACTGTDFSYDTWLAALKKGQTFITNGPALLLSVDGYGPGAFLPCTSKRALEVKVEWRSFHPIEVVEIVRDGFVIARKEFATGSREGSFVQTVLPETDGWIAARCSGNARDSFDQAIFAHTSPVYVQTGALSPAREEAARFFADVIRGSVDWVNTKGRFHNKQQRTTVLNLFREGAAVYEGMLRKAHT